MLLWAAKLHIIYADLSNVLFVNLMDAIKMMMMMMYSGLLLILDRSAVQVQGQASVLLIKMTAKAPTRHVAFRCRD